jgi:hypothetical protein
MVARSSAALTLATCWVLEAASLLGRSEAATQSAGPPAGVHLSASAAAAPGTGDRGIGELLPPGSTARNVAVLLGAGAVAFGVTWALPEDVSQWDKSRPISYYLRRAYTEPPVWDDDHFVFNWVLHPLMGQYVYLMERNHGRSALRGLLLSTAASVGWEYGFEAFMERPSIQDLLITSPVGSVLGELSYRLTRRMRRGGFGTGERIALTVINPTYVLQYGYKE